MGNGHSGSTLLDLLLGSHSLIESGGEFKNYSKYVVTGCSRLNVKCTCGELVSDCMYWNSVKNRFFNSLRNHNVKIHENGNMDEFSTFAAVRSVLDVSGKSLFVDSSKGLGRLKHYLSSCYFDVSIIHLVRDGRAVAYSSKKKNRNYYKQIYKWSSRNKEIDNIYSGYQNYLLLKYEDLVKDPKNQLARVLNTVNCNYENNQLHFNTYKHHNLGGNRMRMIRDNYIKFDDSYLKYLTHIEWYLGSIIASQTLKKFGYSYKKNYLDIECK